MDWHEKKRVQRARSHVVDSRLGSCPSLLESTGLGRSGADGSDCYCATATVLLLAIGTGGPPLC